jgi:hypothetical protein
VSALLRQPAAPARSWLEDLFDPLARFWEELNVRREVEEDRRRFEAAKTRHEQRVRAIEEHERPHALKGKGVTAKTTVDEDTAGLIQAALAESRILRPYIKGKFPKSSIPGKMKIHGSDAEFEYAYETENKVKDSPAAVKAEAEKARGFYHRRSGTIHLRPRSNLGHALHEAMHKLAAPGFLNFFGRFWEEGVAQYFADCVLLEQGLQPMKGHLYEDELRCAKRLVAFTDRDLVARAYFLDHQPLMNRLIERLGGDHAALKDLIERKTLCDRLR